MVFEESDPGWALARAGVILPFFALSHSLFCELRTERTDEYTNNEKAVFLEREVGPEQGFAQSGSDRADNAETMGRRDGRRSDSSRGRRDHEDGTIGQVDHDPGDPRDRGRASWSDDWMPVDGRYLRLDRRPRGRGRCQGAGKKRLRTGALSSRADSSIRSIRVVSRLKKPSSNPKVMRSSSDRGGSPLWITSGRSPSRSRRIDRGFPRPGIRRGFGFDTMRPVNPAKPFRAY